MHKNGFNCGFNSFVRRAFIDLNVFFFLCLVDYVRLGFVYQLSMIRRIDP